MKIPKKTKCCIGDQDTHVFCKSEVYGDLKVQVAHEETGRKTWQTWKLCNDHFLAVVANPSDWYRWYRNGNIAHVIRVRLFF